jgi:putative Mg2+ transporter-C (MgtC) family protein
VTGAEPKLLRLWAMGEALLALDTLEIMLRLGLATLAGAVLGFDRERRGHPAGIRTNGIVALSSAILTVSALLIFIDLRSEGAQPDPLRVIQGLAQAIGFIAAGLIFVKGGDVHNLTTAANLWLATAIGIACGAGQYAVVGVAMLFGLVLVTLGRIAKKLIPGIPHSDAEKRRAREDAAEE